MIGMYVYLENNKCMRTCKDGFYPDCDSTTNNLYWWLRHLFRRNCLTCCIHTNTSKYYKTCHPHATRSVYWFKYWFCLLNLCPRISDLWNICPQLHQCLRMFSCILLLCNYYYAKQSPCIPNYLNEFYEDIVPG